jgi:hypothetical protein
MNKELLKIAKYLGSNGHYAEAAQLKKLAMDSDTARNRHSPEGNLDFSREFFIKLDPNMTIGQKNDLKDEIKAVCTKGAVGNAGPQCEISDDEEEIGGEDVLGLRIKLKGIPGRRDVQTELEELKLVKDLKLKVHNVRELEDERSYQV